MTTTEAAATDQPPAGVVRCSTADRERTAGRLHEAAGDGRLTMDETEQRLGQAYQARYQHELDALTADLAAPSPSPSGWRLVFAVLRQQLLADLAVLLGRAPGSRTRRIATLLVGLAVLAFVASALMMLLHGMFWPGPGVGHGGRGWPGPRG